MCYARKSLNSHEIRRPSHAAPAERFKDGVGISTRRCQQHSFDMSLVDKYAKHVGIGDLGEDSLLAYIGERTARS
jgi:hypothetical protein